MKIHLNVPIKKNVEEIKQKIEGNQHLKDDVDTVIGFAALSAALIVGFKIGRIKTENVIMKQIIGIV